MNTPLQQAAQAVLDRWDSPLWKDMPATADYIADLRKALADEQAQAVEPVAWLVRWRPTKHEPRDINPWVALSIAEYRSNPSREERPLFTHPAPPPTQQVAVPVAMTDSQISDAWESIHPSKEYPVTRLGRRFARAIEAHHGIGAKP